MEIQRTRCLREPSCKKMPGGFVPVVVSWLAQECVQCDLPRPALPAVTFSGFLFFLPFGRVLPWLPRNSLPRRVRASPLPIIPLLD